jgi:hypothetical protein
MNTINGTSPVGIVPLDDQFEGKVFAIASQLESMADTEETVTLQWDLQKLTHRIKAHLPRAKNIELL